ncbi:MAG TPA: HEAT repeat domain-containing protein [Vicinamibacterales bacterium]|mgnify:CR=1 FL=1|nr:HEAT repeat domain-containing protein [Vicinamibacterales bacterium]HOG29648.1 HEAT repeat domain-containing protein [Vicinamibacterales bacterium]HPW21754.1 HEAT repeat domain-containing protein [Vicinamibacterales bacterium]
MSERVLAGIVAGLLLWLPAGAAAAAAPPQGRQVAFEQVVESLKSPDAKARLGAIQLLREAGYLEAAPAIAPLLADPDDRVRAAAIEGLVSMYLVDERHTREFGRGLIREKGATLPLYAFVQREGVTIPNLAPPEVIRGLIGAAASPNLRIRFDAAYALAVLGRPLVRQGQFPDGRAAVNALMAILREPDPLMRLAATHALGRLMGAARQSPGASPELTAQRTEVGDQIVVGMNDPDEDVRLASMGALGEMRYERGVQSLTDLYNYYKKGVEGMTALDALAKIAHPGSLPVFLAQLGHREAHIRRLAIEGIGRTGDEAAMREMESRTGRDQSPYVTYARAFARALNRDYSQLPKLVEGFKYSLLESDTFDYLVELGPPAAAELAALAANKDQKVRAGIAEVLGITGSQASLETLAALAADRADLVAAAAERSQKRLVPRDRAAPRAR